MQTVLKTYEIDGLRFDTLEGFFEEISTVIIPGHAWGRNLDAFNDVLRGGFGTPTEGFRLVWRNAPKSQADLGYAETERQLSFRLSRCHPESRAHVSAELVTARTRSGPTVFDWLVDIIKNHDDIELVLA